MWCYNWNWHFLIRDKGWNSLPKPHPLLSSQRQNKYRSGIALWLVNKPKPTWFKVCVSSSLSRSSHTFPVPFCPYGAQSLDVMLHTHISRFSYFFKKKLAALIFVTTQGLNFRAYSQTSWLGLLILTDRLGLAERCSRTQTEEKRQLPPSPLRTPGPFHYIPARTGSRMSVSHSRLLNLCTCLCISLCIRSIHCLPTCVTRLCIEEILRTSVYILGCHTPSLLPSWQWN